MRNIKMYKRYDVLTDAMVKAAESILKHDRCMEASKEYCMPIKEILTLIPEEY